jgi:hypothetical protein
MLYRRSSCGGDLLRIEAEEELEKGRQHLLALGVDLKKKVIGIHTGGGRPVDAETVA